MDETIGKRLRKAIHEWGFIRGFQREMEERLRGTNVRGYTYPSINGYLKDQTTPSVGFLETAADLLGVRSAWLTSGQGQMTEKLEEKQRDPPRPERDPLRLEWQRLMERRPWLRNLPTGTREAFLDLWLAYRRQVPGGQRALRDIEGGDEVALELADDLLFLLTLQLRAWGFEEPTWLTGRAVETMELPWREPDYTAYFHLQIIALSLVIKLPTHGDRLDGWQESVVPKLRRFDERRDPEPSEALQSLSATIQEQLDELLEERSASADKYFEERRQRALENARKGHLIMPWAKSVEPSDESVECRECGGSAWGTAGATPAGVYALRCKACGARRIVDAPPAERLEPLSGSDLIACEFCGEKVRGDEHREHVESEHAGEAPW